MTILGRPDMASEVARQTVGEAVAAQGTLRRYVDRHNQRANVYVASWEAFHEAGLRAMWTLQSSFLQASQAVIEASLWATPLAVERPSEPAQLWLDPTLKLTAGSSRFLPGRTDASADSDAPDAREWADSALRFPPPLGRLFESGEEAEGEPGLV
jgi:hypothetical protein